MDFTDVTCGNYNSTKEYMEHSLRTFNSVDEIKTWIQSNQKVDTTKLFSVQFEECVVNDDMFYVLWQDPNLNIEVKGVSVEDLPVALKASKDACYSVRLVDYANILSWTK